MQKAPRQKRDASRDNAEQAYKPSSVPLAGRQSSLWGGSCLTPLAT